MTLRRLAGESWNLPHFESVREPMGSPLAMCCRMISRNTSRARGSRSRSCSRVVEPWVCWHSRGRSARQRVGTGLLGVNMPAGRHGRQRGLP